MHVDNKSELPANWIHMKDTEIVRVVTVDNTSAEYKGLETKFLDSVKKGIYNIGKAPNPANNPVGQFNNVKVHKVNCFQFYFKNLKRVKYIYLSNLEIQICSKI